MIKKAICRVKNNEGQYVIVHFETDADVVRFEDGKNLKEKMEEIEGFLNHVDVTIIDDSVVSLDKTLSSDKIVKQLLGKADVVHTHSQNDIEGLSDTLKTFLTSVDLDEIRESLANKSENGHKHATSDVEGLSDLLSNHLTNNDLEPVLQALEGKSDKEHQHGLSSVNDWRTHLYDKTEVNDLLNALALGFTWKAPVDSLDDLPQNPELGWSVIVGGTSLYVYSEEGWIDLGVSSLPPVATQEFDGLMSRVDKAKLDSMDADKLARLDLDALNRDIQANREGLSTKASLSHTHTIVDVAGLQEALSSRYTKEEVDNLFETLDFSEVNGKVAVNTQAIQNLSTELTTLDEYVKALNIVEINDSVASVTSTWSGSKINETINNAISGKANTNHSHEIENIRGLQAQLEARYTKDEVNGLFDNYVPEVNIPQATEQADGLMSKEDKKKLNQLNPTTVSNLQTSVRENADELQKMAQDLTGLETKVNKNKDGLTSLKGEVTSINEVVSKIDLNAPRIYAQAEAPLNPVAGTIWIKTLK